MEKIYNPQQIEETWYQSWEESGYFKPETLLPGQPSGRSYSIAIPPPNVTGYLHMGHAFQDTIMDLLIRCHRMKGDQTLWQVGTDHAGIATQMVVERQLAAEGRSRHDLGRDAFLDRVWQWKARSGGTITRQLRRMGASCDWSRERFTMGSPPSVTTRSDAADLPRAVTEVFVRLYEQGLIYRGQRLVNWDPVLQTAISDLEVVSEEEQGHLWHIRYQLANGATYTDEHGQVRDHIIVATTRPETLLGDAAVAVHPDDERYRRLIGKTVRLPLCDRRIPIIADAYVDPAFGTGCLKITPAHDFNDYIVGERHGLPKLNVMTSNACINEAAPAAYQGLDRFEARQRIVADLEAAGLLESVKDHKLMVPRGDRTGAVVEPYLTDQWYVDLTRETLPDGRPGGLAAITRPALEAVRSGRIRLIPDHWEKTYAQWLENIQDWCISRQIWWGHRIPAWYDCETGQVYVGRNEAEVRAKHRLGPEVWLSQDKDVLDTWFSSALWPFSTLGWPDATPDLARFYPTSVLVTGFDIIFFWVARMIMLGLRFTDQAPFHQVYIHGLVRDQAGQKMSKSKGNVLDPLDLIDGIGLDELVAKRTSGLMQPEMAPRIEKQTRKQFPDGIPAYGTDALRFAFASQATLGRDIHFDLARVESYRNFCTKLWNAARFVLLHTEGRDCGQEGGAVALRTADRWILSRLQSCVEDVESAIGSYRFDFLASSLFHFAKDEYCDWYIELCKPLLAQQAPGLDTDTPLDEAGQRGVRKTLVQVLETLLRLAHPLIPFITEEIWQRVRSLSGGPRLTGGEYPSGHKGHSIMVQPWPAANPELIDRAAEEEIEWLRALLGAVRNIRGEMHIPPNKAVPVLLQNGSAMDRKRLAEHRRTLQSLGKIAAVEWLDDGQPTPEASMSLVGGLQVMVPLAGLIDRADERDRLEREIGKLRGVLQKSQAKLANRQFVEHAPQEVVERERALVEQLLMQLGKLARQEQAMGD